MAQPLVVRGSYGTLFVDRATGFITGRAPDDPNDDQYADILYFDPARLPDVEVCDILGTAFVDASGRYIIELVSVIVDPVEEYHEWVEQHRLK